MENNNFAEFFKKKDKNKNRKLLKNILLGTGAVASLGLGGYGINKLIKPKVLQKIADSNIPKANITKPKISPTVEIPVQGYTTKKGKVVPTHKRTLSVKEIIEDVKKESPIFKPDPTNIQKSGLRYKPNINNIQTSGLRYNPTKRTTKTRNNTKEEAVIRQKLDKYNSDRAKSENTTIKTSEIRSDLLQTDSVYKTTKQQRIIKTKKKTKPKKKSRNIYNGFNSRLIDQRLKDKIGAEQLVYRSGATREQAVGKRRLQDHELNYNPTKYDADGWDDIDLLAPNVWNEVQKNPTYLDILHSKKKIYERKGTRKRQVMKGEDGKPLTITRGIQKGKKKYETVYIEPEEKWGISIERERLEFFKNNQQAIDTIKELIEESQGINADIAKQKAEEFFGWYFTSIDKKVSKQIYSDKLKELTGGRIADDLIDTMFDIRSILKQQERFRQKYWDFPSLVVESIAEEAGTYNAKLSLTQNYENAGQVIVDRRGFMSIFARSVYKSKMKSVANSIKQYIENPGDYQYITDSFNTRLRYKLAQDLWQADRKTNMVGANWIQRILNPFLKIDVKKTRYMLDMHRSIAAHPALQYIEKKYNVDLSISPVARVIRFADNFQKKNNFNLNDGFSTLRKILFDRDNIQL